MKIMTWNINGIRSARGKTSTKSFLDSLNADIICLQETKISRDMLDETAAIVDDYESYFSFSRKKTGYSGTANYCKKTTAPVKAEEGLTGKLSSHNQTAVGCYGNMKGFSNDDLEALDVEGRCVITQHKIRLPSNVLKDLAIVNVYAPRAGEKEDRLRYKLKFLSLLQSRCESLLKEKIHVIVVGDMNMTHKQLDTCESEYDVEFLRLPSRIWFNGMLQKSERDTSLPAMDSYLNEIAPPGLEGGHFSDVFRYLHPDQANAYTNWYTTNDHRQTNYGRRLDYILVDTELAGFATKCEIQPEVEGSDHCPVVLTLECEPVPSTISPKHCSKFMPEFRGQQQKLSIFFGKTGKKSSKSGCFSAKNSRGCHQASNLNSETGEFLNSQVQKPKVECMQAIPLAKNAPLKRGTTQKEQGCKKQKTDSKRLSSNQVNLNSFFTKSKNLNAGINTSATTSDSCKACDKIVIDLEEDYDLDDLELSPNVNLKTLPPEKESLPLSHLKGFPSSGMAEETINSKTNSDVWKALLKGPSPPPLCPGHKEPCILKTVTKRGPNKNKQFYVCSRPDGAPGNPELRCNFFQWLNKKSKKL
ncbi:unnamed protein product [Lymnaea stagnalis]|uniref:DNA-(apurinic or apyrimidinic site) endonuclease n=1 Tax=Lymnaea stagnalis TaxID=6523 RepID=A0AAV2I681_LYMST